MDLAGLQGYTFVPLCVTVHAHDSDSLTQSLCKSAGKLNYDTTYKQAVEPLLTHSIIIVLAGDDKQTGNDCRLKTLLHQRSAAVHREQADDLRATHSVADFKLLA